jgi:hypothetical protein
MQFTLGVGVVIAKEELKAILAFSDEHIAIRIHNGKFLAWGTDGSNSIYNRGDAFNGEGKPFKGFYDWEIDTNALTALNRMMQSGDEVVLETTEGGLMTRYKVRDIESSSTVLEGSLDGRVSTQITLDLPTVLPEKPPEFFTRSATMNWSPAVLKMLDDVGKAVGKGSTAQFWIPAYDDQKTYVQVDTRKSFVDGDEPRWLVILAPIRLENEIIRVRNRDTDERQEPLSFDRAPPTSLGKAINTIKSPSKDTTITFTLVDVPVEETDEVARELKKRSKKKPSKTEEKPQPSLEDLEDDNGIIDA